MNTNKFKSDNKKSFITTNDLISFAISAKVPPLTNSIEIEGKIINEYPFIRGNRAILEWKYSNYKTEISSSNLMLLSSRKNEIVNQIELNRNYCIGKYNEIKLYTDNWLQKKFQIFGWDGFYLSNSELNNINTFLTQINTMQSWIMIGMEMDCIIKKLKKRYSPVIEVEPDSIFKSTITLDINDLIGIIIKLIESIETVVSRTVPLYFEYVNIQSKLLEFDIKELFNEIDQEAVYVEILNSDEGVKAGKIALVQYVKEQFDCKTEPEAFKKANEIHMRVKGKYLYKSFKGYEPSKSSVNMKDVYKILNRVK